MTYGYSFGAGVYLTRRVVAHRDFSALMILLKRILKGGVWLSLGGFVLAKPWHLKSTWMRLTGTLAGTWAVLSVDRRYGITRSWLNRF